MEDCFFHKPCRQAYHEDQLAMLDEEIAGIEQERRAFQEKILYFFWGGQIFLALLAVVGGILFFVL